MPLSVRRHSLSALSLTRYVAAAAVAAGMLAAPTGAGAVVPSVRPVAAVGTTTAAEGDADRGDPRLTRPFYVNRDSQAWRISRQDRRFRPIGNTPQAYWVSDTHMPLSTVRRQVREYAVKANRAGRTPLVAIYAIPNRDCGGHSAGGWSPARYRTWTKRLAAGLRGQHAMAVLEPDALGLLGSCEGQGDRTGLLRHAARVLSRAGVWVYIDAAHANWIEPAEMARRLDLSGIRFARGFTTNVASFVRTSVEKTYARQVARALKDRGHPGKKYLMDTSRNGNGRDNGNDWCNPPGARLGRTPQMIGRGRFDGYVWVKGPGESDGTCRGGPPAGQWFARYALMLMGRG